MFEWKKSVHYWWSYILFSPECKELTSMLDPLLYRWGVPPIVIRCVHWTMQMGVLQTWIKAQDIVIVMVFAGFVDKFFGHFRPEIGYGARQSESRNLYKMLPIYSSSIWHKAFDPPRLGDIYNPTKSPTAKLLTGTLQRIRSAPETQLCKVWLKTWKRFYSDGKCPLDGTWCQRNNCQSSYKGEITPEETDR